MMARAPERCSNAAIVSALRAALSPYGLETERAMLIAIDYLELQLNKRREPLPA